MIHQAGSFIRKHSESRGLSSSVKKIGLVSDENVYSFYGEKVVSSLISAGYEVFDIILPAGEKTKCQENLSKIYDAFIDFGLTRSDMTVALGGGVIGDLAGFAAATLLRGIPYIQIPTSLLAQVDSSVGGKVAIDLPKGKNLVGAFYQPSMVLIDPSCLNTLPGKFISDGFAEIIKYGCIKDANLFEKLSLAEKDVSDKYSFPSYEDIIYTCCDIKRSVVENDEKESGERMLLNFGHTIGHAIERFFEYEKFTHGEAVGLGMVLMTKFSENLGLTKKGCAKQIEGLLKKYGLPYISDLENTDSGSMISDKKIISDNLKIILKNTITDKKSEGDSINIVLLRDIGNSFVYKIKKEKLVNDFLKEKSVDAFL